MATLNTTSIPAKSTEELSDYETLGHDGFVATVNESLESRKKEDEEWEDIDDDEPETINDEFLNDDIFGDEPDDHVQRENVSVKGTDDKNGETKDATEGAISDLSGDQPIQDNGGLPKSSRTVEHVDNVARPVIISSGEVSQPSTTVEIEWDEEAEKRKDEAAFFAKLKELNAAIDTAEANVDEAKEEAKLAKATLNLAIANQKHFTSKGVQYRKKPIPQPIAEPVKQVASTAPPTDGSSTQESQAENIASVPAPVPESEWRTWDTATILDGIEGLGAKKRETLIEHFPTFGKLMDARTEAGKEHVSFHSLLPKGIGESIGTELINRMDAKIVPGM